MVGGGLLVRASASAGVPLRWDVWDVWDVEQDEARGLRLTPSNVERAASCRRGQRGSRSPGQTQLPTMRYDTWLDGLAAGSWLSWLSWLPPGALLSAVPAVR